MKKALIIVDMQNDFLPGGSLAVPNGDMIIEPINQLSKHYDIVIATQDWHPKNHHSFASSHKEKQPFEFIEINGFTQQLWPDHCIQNTFGAAISDKIDQTNIQAIIRKGTDIDIDSYSSFFDNEHKNNTGLDGYLKGKGVDSIAICGLAADICVYYTAKDAYELGYRVTILESATLPINHSNYEHIKQELSNIGVLFI